MGLLFFFLEDDRYESGKKERTIGWGVWSRVALLLTRGGATSIYTVGRTERKKTTKESERERKKKKKGKNDVTRERYTHIDAFCVFLLFFKYHFNTQTYARATPTPAKTKTKKTSDVAALNENLRKE